MFEKIIYHMVSSTFHVSLSTEHAASEQLLDSLARFQYIAAELRDVLVSVCWITGICKFKKRRGRRERQQ